jgi:hypothetical protein
MSLRWEEYLSNNQYASDNEARAKFGRLLMLAFKQKNISEGITAGQAIWLHSRMREFTVNFPGMPPVKVDVLNMALSGDIEAGCLALIYGVVDDMSEPYHWVSNERRNWLVAQCKEFLGWP